MMLLEHDKEMIQLIDNQVKILTDKDTPDHTIITTLADFVPEIRCLVSAFDKQQFDNFCSKYIYFSYFLELIGIDV